MRPRSRLAVFLATFLAGCEDPATLDGEACIDVEGRSACPSGEAAAEELLTPGGCNGAIHEIVEVGELSRRDVVSGSDHTLCCYEVAYSDEPSCVDGRPLRVGDGAVTACAVARADWARGALPEVHGLAPEVRSALARGWERAGLSEHASIPAFARALLDLVALGAPADLVARTSAAIADETLHAELCFALASAYAGEPVGPGALPVPARRRPSLRRLAVETFREGCVGETLAVGLAAARLREATDPVVRAVLERIVADETRHAELAWDTVRWAIAVGGRPVARAMAREIEVLAPPAGDHPTIRAVFEQVVRPSAAELLAA